MLQLKPRWHSGWQKWQTVEFEPAVFRPRNVPRRSFLIEIAFDFSNFPHDLDADVAPGVFARRGRLSLRRLIAKRLIFPANFVLRDNLLLVEIIYVTSFAIMLARAR